MQRDYSREADPDHFAWQTSDSYFARTERALLDGVSATPSDRVATLLKKIKNNDFGQSRPAPEKLAPKPLPAAEAPAAEEAPAEAGEAPA